MEKNEHFQLDSRLSNDCIILGDLDGQPVETTCLLLLMDNADIPWFVIVPTGTTVIDIDELPERHQLTMLKNMNDLSGFLKQHYSVDKINFASIGNVVNQLHFHLVARTEQDMAWPGVVWGVKAKNKYTQKQVEGLKCALEKNISNFNVNK